MMVLPSDVKNAKRHCCKLPTRPRHCDDQTDVLWMRHSAALALPLATSYFTAKILPNLPTDDAPQ
jgi:hypothetical protein